jgi:hypothetical protein
VINSERRKGRHGVNRVPEAAIPRARSGRPRTLPVSTVPLTDVQAFWRLKDNWLDSYQAVRAVAFCALWQQHHGQMDRVVAAAEYGRRTAFSHKRRS